MEAKKSHRSRRQKARPQKSNVESKPCTDIRRQIERISTVSGSNNQPHKFHKKEKREMESQARRIPNRRVKNINLYEDDFGKDCRKRSDSLDEYAHEHEIIADIRTMNAGISYSNRKLEHWWGGNDKSSESELGSSMSDDCGKNGSGCSSLKRDEEKFRRNVLFTSLLKNRREQLEKEHDKLDVAPITVNGNHKTQNDCLSHIVRDPIDPDFFYRRMTVADPTGDYTVEHVGKVNVVRARQYLIQSFDNDDFTFCRRNPRRSVSSRATDNQS